LGWRQVGLDYVPTLSELAVAPGVDQLLNHCAGFDFTSAHTWHKECRRLFYAAPQGAEALRRIAVREQIFPPSASREAVGFARGVVWALPLLGADEAIPLLVHVADQNGRQGQGQAYASVARAAVRALGSVGGERTLAPLRRLKAEAPLAAVRKAASRELDKVLSEAGLTRAEVPEWLAETFELNRDGERATPLGGGYTAAVRISPGGRVKVTYRDRNGRTMAGKPAAREAAEGVRSVTELAVSMRSVVDAEKFRLRQLMADHRQLSVEDWLAHYLEHPVTGALSRTLIWEYSTDSGERWEPGLPVLDDEGTWRLWTVEDPLHTIPAEAAVRLRRPLKSTSREAAFWRRRLKDRELTQSVDQLG
jgi:hypothetical protein